MTSVVFVVANVDNSLKSSEPDSTKQGHTESVTAGEQRTKRGRNNSDPRNELVVPGPDAKRVQRVLEAATNSLSQRPRRPNKPTQNYSKLRPMRVVRLSS